MDNKLKISYVLIKDLKPAEYNPRQMTEKQAADLEQSIKRFGIVDPVIVNQHPGRSGTIIGGHQRVKIAERLGINTVPVVYVDLDEVQEKELNLRLNKNLGEWDFDMLANFDTEMLEDVGWGKDELADIFQLDLPGGGDGNGDADAVPDPPKEPESRYGDLYQLGRHRLLCGDSTKSEDVELLMCGEKADMVFTDPPYGVDYASKNKMLNDLDNGKRNQKHIANDSVSNYREFFFSFLSIIPLNNYNIAYICMSSQELHNLRMGAEDSGFKWGDYLVWVKNNHVLGRKDYNSKHEFVMYCWKGKHKFYGEFSTTIIEVDKPLKNDLHPTMKPVKLMEKFIADGSLINMNIYDCFGGSGSTLIACEKTNRRCFMMELDPGYIDVIIKRWEDYTGQKAVKL